MVSTRGGGQLGEDEPGREDGIKRTRVEEKSDDGMSTVTATANTIDEDWLSQEPRKLEDSTNATKRALGQAQIEEHFERVRTLKESFLLSIPNRPTTRSVRSRVVDQGQAELAVFVPFGLRFAKLLRYQSHILQSDGIFLRLSRWTGQLGHLVRELEGVHQRTVAFGSHSSWRS